jgi:signal transduction histidine kinase
VGAVKRPARKPARLYRRLAPQLALMTAVVVGVTLGAGIWLIEEERRRIGDREARRAQQVAIHADERRLATVELAVEHLVERIQGDPAVLRQLLGREPVSPELARELGRGTELDALELSSGDGLVLSSLHWPERAGLSARRTVPLFGRAKIETPQGQRVGWFATHQLRIGQQRIALVAGTFLDADWLAEAAALAGAAWWIPAGEAPKDGYPTTGAGEDLPEIAALDRAVDDGPTRADGWRLVTTPFVGADGPLGHVVLGIRDTEDRTAWVRLRGAWAGLTAAAALAAALVGMVIGRRLARPVDQLVRAVDGIAAGEEDYAFSGMPADEFDALAASFSRLQRSLEQQQRRSAAAERVAAWQEVARHVAHEVKNPLAPIRLTVQNLQRARTTHPEVFGRLFEEGSQTILEEVDQLTRLVSEFSDFARLPVPDRRTEALEPMLDEVLELFASDPALHLVRESDGSLPAVEADRDQILRVFKNIVGNAVEAMAGDAAAELRVSSRADDGYAEVRFCDSGPGFGDEAANRVFEPYFTTKAEGTGLGMAIVYRIIAEHGGEIVAENRPEGGARVTVRLPLA